MATYYAVAAGGPWGTASTWSTVSAKDASRVGNGSVPTASDTCYLDDYSGNVGIFAGNTCSVLDCAGPGQYAGTLTLNTTALAVTGSLLRFSSAMTITGSYFSMTGDGTLTSNGKSLDSFTCAAGKTITLGSNLTVTSLSLGGTLATEGYSLTAGTLTFPSAVAGVASVTGAGVVSVTTLNTQSAANVTTLTIAANWTVGSIVFSSGSLVVNGSFIMSVGNCNTGAIALGLTGTTTLKFTGGTIQGTGPISNPVVFLGGGNTITLTAPVFKACSITYTSGTMAGAGWTIQGTSTITGGGSYPALTLSGTAAVTLSASFTVLSLTLGANSILTGASYTLTVSSALAMSSYSLTGSLGLLQLAGTWSGTGAVSVNLKVTGNVTLLTNNVGWGATGKTFTCDNGCTIGGNYTIFIAIGTLNILSSFTFYGLFFSGAITLSQNLSCLSLTCSTCTLTGYQVNVTTAFMVTGSPSGTTIVRVAGGRLSGSSTIGVNLILSGNITFDTAINWGGSGRTLSAEAGCVITSSVTEPITFTVGGTINMGDVVIPYASIASSGCAVTGVMRCSTFRVLMGTTAFSLSGNVVCENFIFSTSTSSDCSLTLSASSSLVITNSWVNSRSIASTGFTTITAGITCADSVNRAAIRFTGSSQNWAMYGLNLSNIDFTGSTCPAYNWGGTVSNCINAAAISPANFMNLISNV